MIITEPKWKKWVVETTQPIFTPKLCKEIIDLSTALKKERGKTYGKVDKKLRQSTISWIPFNKMEQNIKKMIFMIGILIQI